jgi:SAM-dependent methyltransferase
MQDNGKPDADRQAAIENVLRMHPGVKDAAAIHDGRDSFTAFAVLDDQYMDDIPGRGAAGPALLGKWRKTFDLSQLTKEAASTPVGLNTIGWNSSYTRQPIPVEEIREWVETTVGDILQLAPKAVYEIGCGTGMLLMRIAPICERYVATDFSPVVLSRLREQLRTVPAVAERIEAMERSADNFEGIDDNSFDTVILNSVAQYFPSIAYMTKVMECAVRIVKPGGHIFVGDNRSLPLLPAFESSVELFQAADDMSAGELRARIRRREEREQELVLSPAYFISLQHRLAKLSRVEIRPLRGRANNEMARYRYEAILHAGGETETSSRDEFLDWTECKWTLNEIRSILMRHRNERICIRHIRNARIEKNLTAHAILRDADEELKAGELRRRLELTAEEGIHPQDLIDLESEGMGFSVILSWAACRPDGSYDACFVPAGYPQGINSPAIRWPEPDAREFMRQANAPGQGKLRNELIAQLVAHCSQHLPPEMVPREITLVDTLAHL